jgi:hypothetical protein
MGLRHRSRAAPGELEPGGIEVIKAKGALVIVSAAFIFLLGLALMLNGSEKAATVKPNIYITRTDHILTFEGEEVWILEYTIDGILQAPMFDSRGAMVDYREYLDTVGNVYRKEE